MLAGTGKEEIIGGSKDLKARLPHTLRIIIKGWLQVGGRGAES